MKARLTEPPPLLGEEFHDLEDAETYKKMLARDERRFRAADQDGDLRATREELTAFLHPEEFPHMRDIVVAVSAGLPSGTHPGSSGYWVLWLLPRETQAASANQWRVTSAPHPVVPVSLLVGGFIPTCIMPNSSAIDVVKPPKDATKVNPLFSSYVRTLSSAVWSPQVTLFLCLHF